MYYPEKRIDEFCFNENKFVVIGNHILRDTYDFIATETKYTKESKLLHKKYDMYVENQEPGQSGIKPIYDFIYDLTKTKINQKETFRKSNILTFDISYVPFTYNKHLYIAAWLFDLFVNNYSKLTPAFFELKTQLSVFEDKLHKVYGVCKCGKFEFFDYETDNDNSDMVNYKKDKWYCKKCNNPIHFY